VDGAAALTAELRARHPFVAPEHMARLVRAYGTRAGELLGAATGPADLGRCFGADLFEAEVRYLMDEEWAQTAEDVLWRRSKLGLRLTRDEARELDAWMAELRASLADASDEAAE